MPSQTNNPRMHGSRGVLLGVRRRLLRDFGHRPANLFASLDTDLIYLIPFRTFFLKKSQLDSNEY